jgi:predicted RNase H-like nuclease (RuvC/YqgF family)
MSSNEQTIATFETRVRQMILRFQELKKENADLYAMVEKNEQDLKDLRAKLTQADTDYNTLKMAKMLTITDGDLEGAKARVQKLIRDVNKCIAILTDEQEKD